MSDTPTRVALVFIAQRINVYLRFGRPHAERRIDTQRRVVEFAPGAIFCRIRWEGNDHGASGWQLSVAQAAAPGEPMQRIAGIVPGAALLLHVDGAYAIKPVLRIIDAIEALGVDPTDVPASYWRMLQNRISARVVAPSYTHARHVAHVAVRELT